MARHLRVYPPSPSSDETPPANVRIHLGELLPLVALAHRHDHAWLQDFLDDEVLITADLFEVLRAFRREVASA